VKSRLAIGLSSDGTLVRGGRVWICRTVDEAVDAVATIVNAEGEALLQAKVEGEEYGLGLVRAENGSLVVVVTQRVRSWPPSGGSPSLLRTAIPPDGLVEPLARLLERLGWTGVAQADVLWSAGRPVLLDLNPRIWATVGSSITAGVDVPSAVLAVAHGGQLGAVSPVLDAGWAEADTELRHLACLLADRRGVRHPGESLSGALHRLQRDFRPPIEINPLSSRDPLPAVGYLLWAMPATLFRNNRARRRRRRRARRRNQDATPSGARVEEAGSQ
jgi:carbamoyl-phosphate synthase large subunit